MDVIVTKTEKALKLFRCGMYKESFVILSTFKLGWSKDEKRIIQIAKDCLTGNSSFYRQLGIDTGSIVEEAIALVKEKYGITNKM